MEGIVRLEGVSAHQVCHGKDGDSQEGKEQPKLGASPDGNSPGRSRLGRQPPPSLRSRRTPPGLRARHHFGIQQRKILPSLCRWRLQLHVGVSNPYEKGAGGAALRIPGSHACQNRKIAD
eukprot:49759-Rhodomonas_salina.1